MKTLVLVVVLAAAAWAQPVRSYEGTLTIPTYEASGRELEPALFSNSTVGGMYPFPSYLLPWREGSPKPQTYRAVFVENEYLKITYIPEFGGRIYSLYDKVRQREVLYRNDVVKPAPYNPRMSWPQSGMELTGPHDVHTLTLHGEPYWPYRIVRRPDGAVSLVLGETDPVYQMEVTLTATLHPGLAAMEISIFCYNPREARMPQMFWINTAVPATPKTRFLYQMSRTVGHTTADIADWPVHNGVDYSWDRNNQNMLGVFGIDAYGDSNGAYQFENDYGLFRYADRRVVQGMKLWTFGNGPGAKGHERGYTDKAGPYVELQSGRHVWDGHYEWVAPHKAESWSEWWVPVAGINGVTNVTRDAALNLEVEGSTVRVALASMRHVERARLVVTARGREIGHMEGTLDPAKAWKKEFASAGELAELRVVVTDAAGKSLMDYRRPDEAPGRKEYTPFTRPLEQPRKAVEQMSTEELTLAAEYRMKELDPAGASALLQKALEKDAGYSRAHMLLGIQAFTAGRHEEAVASLEKAIERDPYADQAYYYLTMAQFALGREKQGERNLFYIWPQSAYYGAREYHLGRLRLAAGDVTGAVERFRGAVTANGNDVLARLALALALRQTGQLVEAREQLAQVERIDPTNREVWAERYLAGGDAVSRKQLVELMGGQSQEAMSVAVFYRKLGRWKDAVQVLRLVDGANQDKWGTTPEFYYTLAYCQKRAGEEAAAAASRLKARQAAGKVDRFPYRDEAEVVLRDAVAADGQDGLARFLLGCWLYSREQRGAAVEQWEAAVAASPNDFSSRRSLGLAYAEQGLPLEKAAAQLEKAVQLQPANLRALNDLSALYARAGRFGEQLTLLKSAFARSPKDDDLAEGILTAYLSQGEYAEAERLIAGHQFAVRHRSYGLRDRFRVMRYGAGAKAFARGDVAEALRLIQSAAAPPVSLGVDDFVGQVAPRLEYYTGRVLEKLGRSEEARKAYERAVSGAGQLSGDRDSWNSENFFVVPALEKLGRAEEAARLEKRFENFAMGERDSKDTGHRSEARLLLALVRKHQGQAGEARSLLEGALAARPDLLPARLEWRGDVIEAVPQK
jgi:tetratricopeptide (TPR) repeat protein